MKKIFLFLALFGFLGLAVNDVQAVTLELHVPGGGSVIYHHGNKEKGEWEYVWQKNESSGTKKQEYQCRPSIRKQCYLWDWASVIINKIIYTEPTNPLQCHIDFVNYLSANAPELLNPRYGITQTMQLVQQTGDTLPPMSDTPEMTIEVYPEQQ